MSQNMLNQFIGNFSASKVPPTATLRDDDRAGEEYEQRAQLANNKAGAKINESDQFTVRDDAWFASAHGGKMDEAMRGDAVDEGRNNAFSKLRSWFGAPPHKDDTLSLRKDIEPQQSIGDMARDASSAVSNAISNAVDSTKDMAKDLTNNKDIANKDSNNNVGGGFGPADTLRAKAKEMVKDVTKDEMSDHPEPSNPYPYFSSHVLANENDDNTRTEDSGWAPASDLTKVGGIGKFGNNAGNSPGTYRAGVGYWGGFGRKDIGFHHIRHDGITPDYEQRQKEAESTPSSGAYYKPNQEGPHNTWVALENLYQQRVIQKGKAGGNPKDAAKVESSVPTKAGASARGMTNPYNTNLNINPPEVPANARSDAEAGADSSAWNISRNVSDMTSKVASNVSGLASQALEVVGLADAGDNDYSPSSGSAGVVRSVGKEAAHPRMSQPQNPANLTAFHHSDCATQLEAYEKCLRDSSDDYEQCKNTWNTFSTCKEELMKQ